MVAALPRPPWPFVHEGSVAGSEKGAVGESGCVCSSERLQPRTPSSSCATRSFYAAVAGKLPAAPPPPARGQLPAAPHSRRQVSSTPTCPPGMHSSLAAAPASAQFRMRSLPGPPASKGVIDKSGEVETCVGVRRSFENEARAGLTSAKAAREASSLDEAEIFDTVAGIQKVLGNVERLREEAVTLRKENSELREQLKSEASRNKQFVEVMRRRQEEMKEELAKLQQQRETDGASFEAKVGDVCRERDELLAEVKALRQTDTARRQKLEELEREVCDAGSRKRPRCCDNDQQAGGAMQAETAEGMLKKAMTNPSTATEELQRAIDGVDALLGEARRELSAKQFRDRRAAYEELHAAIAQGDDVRLTKALAQARRTEVDLEDIRKGEETLSDIQSMSPEQRVAKALRAEEKKKKEQAFLYVKKDQLEQLQDLLDNLDKGLRWQDWRDHAGRSLWRCAQELRAAKVQVYLAPVSGHVSRTMFESPDASKEFAPTTQMQSDAGMDADCHNISASASDASALDCDTTMEPGSGSCTPNTGAGSAPNSPPMASREVQVERSPVQESSEDEEELKAKAFRAVVKDDVASLEQVFNALPATTWSSWQNKAGKTLLTLSEERGSSMAYSALAKALGLVQERKLEALSEGEAVWVLERGEVQPRRATVVQSPSASSENVLLEFWEGHDAPTQVARCLVMKSCS